MTPEQQRIAIAKACRVETWQGDCPDDSLTKEGKHLPDYLNDLNAMHEAEKLILNYDAGSHGRYIDHLIDVCGKRKDETWHLAIFHATASQRAEAFLRTLNLWTT